MAVYLGKDLTITGLAGARSFTVTGTSTEVDTTTFGSTSRTFVVPYSDITVEVECIENPGVSAGGTFTIGGTAMGSGVSFICTGVSEEAPVDGIMTWTVSGASTASGASG